MWASQYNICVELYQVFPHGFKITYKPATDAQIQLSYLDILLTNLREKPKVIES